VTIRLFDAGFRRDPARFIIQPALAVMIIMLLMSFHNLLSSVALLAALGASTFVALTMPHAAMSAPRKLIGGYACGAAVGAGCYFLLASGWLERLGADPALARVVLAGLGVGLAIFLMVILDMEHAPAASIALGLVLDAWHPWNVAYVMGGIILLVLFKQWLRPLIRDLV
jgi:CBS-domain-containing membrane protein